MRHARLWLCVVLLAAWAGCTVPDPPPPMAPPDAAGAPDAAGPPDASPLATCNPVTQIRDDGAPACGSADPSMPDLGCYPVPGTSSGIAFQCYPAGTFGHGEVVTPPIHFNSCLPGAIAMFRESSGVTQVVCIAMCEPLRINNTEPDEARDGAEPYSCPEMPHGVGVAGPVAHATGPGERCLHLWAFLDATPQPSAAGNAYGLCIDFTVRTWDHDQIPATPAVPWPLPETTTPCADITNPTTWQPTEDCFWGAAPLP